jgi:hypothetical protein
MVLPPPELGLISGDMMYSLTKARDDTVDYDIYHSQTISLNR